MNFTVDWKPAIRAELHQLWAIAPDPASVHQAYDTIERVLGDDPVKAGRHLSEGLWLIRVPPLLVYYTVDSAQRHVEIIDVFPVA